MATTMREVQEGDWLRVRDDMFTRAGQEGEVIDVSPEGASLDFYCDVFGDPRGAPSIEFWKWSELEVPDDMTTPASPRPSTPEGES